MDVSVVGNVVGILVDVIGPMVPEVFMVSRIDQNPVLHIRFDGRSFDIPLGDLDVGRAVGRRRREAGTGRILECRGRKVS